MSVKNVSPIYHRAPENGGTGSDDSFQRKWEVSMNKNNFLFAMMLGLFLPLMVTRVAAQTGHEVVADIPFDFTVCAAQMPAGKYKLRPMSSTNPRVLTISGDDKRTAEIFCTHDVQGQKRADNGKLIFNRYGNQYFLSELWFQGEATGNQLVKTDQEEALLESKEIRKRGRVIIKVTEVKP